LHTLLVASVLAGYRSHGIAAGSGPVCANTGGDVMPTRFANDHLANSAARILWNSPFVFIALMA